MEQLPIWNDELYEVSRNEYTVFVHRVKPEARDIHEYGTPDGTIHTELWSKNSGIRLCGRTSNPITEEKERYYIWEYPAIEEAQEWSPPAYRVVLETPQQVQAVLDGLKKLHEEQEKNTKN